MLKNQDQGQGQKTERILFVSSGKAAGLAKGTGDRIVMEKLKRPESIKPFVSPKPPDKKQFRDVNLDEPSFTLLAELVTM